MGTIVAAVDEHSIIPVCLVCGHRQPAQTRADFADPEAVCPQCGERGLISTISVASPDAAAAERERPRRRRRWRWPFRRR